MDFSVIQEDIHIKEYADVIKRRRDIIVTFFAAVVLIVTAGSFIIRPVYRATTTLLIDPESPNVLTATGMIEMQSHDYLAYKEYFQSQVEIITSRSLARKVFDDLELIKIRKYAKAKDPIKIFLKTIKVEPVRDTRLLKLCAENRDPELAARIANHMAELYVMRNLYYISKSEILNLLKNEYLKLEARESEFEKIYRAGHPEMIKVKEEMSDILDRIEREKKSVYDYNDIEAYLRRGSQHELSGFKANNISIQDAAEKPITPVRPRKMLNIVISIIIGLFGGVGLAFFLEYLDDNAKTIDDVEKVMKWPFLVNIPDIGIGGEYPKDFEKDLMVNSKPKDPIAEIYRSLRTKIFFSSTEDHPLRSMMITSPGPQEGKTITLCNLGIAISQNKKKVLLVDADMRKPRLHNVFKKGNNVGLSNYLSGQCLFGDVIQKTAIENLYMVSGGIIPPNPSELLNSHKTKEFIAKAKENYDIVLLDTPPVGIVTDAVIISMIVDGTVMVVQGGRSSKRFLAHIYDLLIAAKARVVGTVINRVAVTDGNPYYSYYYQDAVDREK